MVCLGAKRLGVFVGAALTLAAACGADPHRDALEEERGEERGEALELVAKPETLIIPEAGRPSSVAVCVSEVFVAQPLTVNLYLMIDRSGSMQEGNKWGQSMGALRDFVQDPDASGLRVALRFFGDDEPVVGCSQHECSIEACAQPLVEAATLVASVGVQDKQEQTLLEVLDNTLPLNGFGTPIYPALGGALKWAADYKAAHNDENTAVVFVTDGEPNGCDTNIDHISGLASEAFATYGVRTYAIGLQGSNEQQINELAHAGQTQDGIFIGESQGAEEKLLEALNEIRTRAMRCDFVLPAPADGETADTETMNLVMQTPAQKAEMYRVDDAALCTSDGLGWYFDDVHNPKGIHLCPSTCARSKDESETSISVVMGCVETRRTPGLVR